MDDEVLGSIECAFEHFGIRLVMVLGHEQCGAVSATPTSGEAPGQLQPAVAASRGEPGDSVHNCVAANARRSAHQIRFSAPTLRPLAEAGKVRVIAADYDLATGKVALLKD